MSSSRTCFRAVAAGEKVEGRERYLGREMIEKSVTGFIVMVSCSSILSGCGIRDSVTGRFPDARAIIRNLSVTLRIRYLAGIAP